MVVNETNIASLQCEFKGNPTPQVTWMKQNSSLPLNKRITQSGGGLTIRNVTSQDGGVYTCRARNILGVMTSSATLAVQGNLLPSFNVPVVSVHCHTTKQLTTVTVLAIKYIAPKLRKSCGSISWIYNFWNIYLHKHFVPHATRP